MIDEIVLLGATGSIGMQTVEVCLKKKIKINAISFGRNINNALKIINNFDIKYISVIDEITYLKLKEIKPNLLIEYGKDSIIKAINYGKNIVNAISGIAGLEATIETINLKKNLFLANKESLVVAGDIIKQKAQINNVKIIPIDSEHNAIYRLLQGSKEVRKLIITASGGALLNKNRDELSKVNVLEALNHPNWSMGKKITIDSATMVNKGLEVIEAHYLFDFDYDHIETIIHKESVIHSMVEYNDNSVGAVMYNPSMIIPIQNAILGNFENTDVNKIDFEKLKSLTFQKMDYKRFPMIKLAYDVGKKGGLYPTVYNASNEVAVKLFLDGKITFLQIEEIINDAVKNISRFISSNTNYSIKDILDTDEKIKKYYIEVIK